MPPKPWLCPVPKFVKLMWYLPPTVASMCSTLAVKPCGGSHFAIASGSMKALYTRSGGALKTRCRRTVPVVLPVDLSLMVIVSLDRVRG